MDGLGFNFVTKIENSENMAKNTLKVYKDVLKAEI
jgi:hypothetical protein